VASSHAALLLAVCGSCTHIQSIPWDMCDRTCACPHTRKIFCTCEKSPMLTSLSTVQSLMPNRNFVVATATLVTVTFCFHNSALSCFILKETFNILQQQETLYCRYTNFGSHVRFQIIKSNHPTEKDTRANWRSCTNVFRAWTGDSREYDLYLIRSIWICRFDRITLKHSEQYLITAPLWN